MEEKFKAPQIEFNEQYDKNLIDTPYYRVLASHLKEIYPLVYAHLTQASLLESYLEPKVVKFLEFEIEYQKEQYPIDGAKELAYKDVFIILASELQDHEKIEYLEQFDLDKHSFIDTEDL